MSYLMSTKRAYPSNQERQRQLAAQQAKMQQQQLQASPKQKTMGTKESFEFIWRKLMELESKIKMDDTLNNRQPQKNQDIAKLKQEIASQKKEMTLLSKKLSSTSDNLMQLQTINITLQNEINSLKNDLQKNSFGPIVVDTSYEPKFDSIVDDEEENNVEENNVEENNGEEVNIGFTPGEEEDDDDDE